MPTLNISFLVDVPWCNGNGHGELSSNPGLGCLHFI